MFPFYDNDTGIIYLASKGDSSIRYFEVSGGNQLNMLKEFSTGIAQGAVAMLPKILCNVNTCEIAKFLKVTSNNRFHFFFFFLLYFNYYHS